MCDCVTGSFEYSGPTTELAGKKIPGAAQNSYELDGGAVSIRISHSLPSVRNFQSPASPVSANPARIF